MFEFQNKIINKKCEIVAEIGEDQESFEGIVRHIYSNFVEIEESDGQHVFIHERNVVYIKPFFDPSELDEKKKKGLFG